MITGLFIRRVLSGVIIVILASMLTSTSTSALGADTEANAKTSADPALVKQLKNNLCADSTKADLLVRTATAPVKGLEAKGVCVECAAKPKTEPIAKALDTAQEQERIKRDLAYFRRFSEEIETPESLVTSIKRYTRAIEAIKKAKEKATLALVEAKSLSSATVSLGEAPSKISETEKKSFAKLLEEGLSAGKKEIALYASSIEETQKQVDKYSKGGPEHKGMLKFNQEALAGQQKEYAELRNEFLAIEEAVNWAKGSSATPPSKAAVGAATAFLKRDLDRRNEEVAEYQYNLESNEKKLAQKQERLKSLEKEQKKWSLDTGTEAGFKLLKDYESSFDQPDTADNNGFRLCGLSAAEIHALANYTGEGYDGLNHAIRTGGQEHEWFKPFEVVLNSALSKLNSHTGMVIRAASLPEHILDQHKVGDTVTYAAYTSASLEAGYPGKHIFAIKSKTGKYIAPYSVHAYEQEVLFKPGTKFKILSRKEIEDGKIEFVMEEVADETKE